MKSNPFDLKFFLSIPIINVIAQVTVNYFHPATINPGTIRAILLAVLCIYFVFYRLKFNSINKMILLFIFYLFLLVLLSSNVFLSGYNWLKISLSTMMLPMAYYYITSYKNLMKLNNIILISLVILIINILVSNIFNLGTSDYLDKSFYFGSGKVNITKIMAIILLASPLAIGLIKIKSNKNIYFIIYFISFIIVLVGVKRSALLSIILGILIFFILSPIKSKNIRYLIFFILIIFITSPLYLDTFTKRYESRREVIELTSGSGSTDKDARLNEIYMVLSNLEMNNLKHALTGSEVFNDKEYFNVTRMLHTDYMIMLNGSGIIGLFMFLFIYYLIYKEKKKYNFIINNFFNKQLNAVFYSILFAGFVMSVAGTVYDITLRSMIFTYLGAILGLLRHEAILEKNVQLK